MDKIIAGRLENSITFTLDTAGLTIADMKLGYIRWREGDGTTFTETLSIALTELANINTSWTANFAKYLDADATGGNKFVIRVDVPDAAFALSADRVICNVYDDGNNIVAQRIFDLKADLKDYKDGFVYVDSGAAFNTGEILGLDGVINKKVTDMVAAQNICDKLLNNKIEINGTHLNLDLDLSDYELRAASRGDTIGGDNVTGLSIFNSKLTDLIVSGDLIMNGNSHLVDCTLNQVLAGVATAGLQGSFERCIFNGENFLANGATTLLKKCYGSPTGNQLDAAIFTFITGAGDTAMYIMGFSGNLTLKAMTEADDLVEIYSDGQTNLIIDATCTNGTVILNGIGNHTNNGSGTVTTTNWQELPLSDASLTSQQVRDAMKLAPTGGAPAAGSVDEHLDTIEEDTNELQTTDLYQRYQGVVRYTEGSGNTNSVYGVDGVPGNPVSSSTALKALIDNIFTPNVAFIEGTIQLSENWHNIGAFQGRGFHSVINLNGQNGSDNIFDGLVLNGAFASADDETIIRSCLVQNVTNLSGVVNTCLFDGTIGVGASPGGLNVYEGRPLNNLTCTFDVSGTNKDLDLDGWNGDCIIDGADDAGSSINVVLQGGTLTINNCIAGTITVEGEGRVVLTGTPGATINTANIEV